MKRNFLRCFYLSLIFILMCSCGKDSDDGGCSASETDQRQQTLNAAQSVSLNAQILYQSDPTMANCQAYRQAYQDYLSALSSWITCLNGPARDQWNQVYSMQAQELDTIQC